VESQHCHDRRGIPVKLTYSGMRRLPWARPFDCVLSGGVARCVFVAGAGSGEAVHRALQTNLKCNPCEMAEGFFSAPVSWPGLGVVRRG